MLPSGPSCCCLCHCDVSSMLQCRENHVVQIQHKFKCLSLLSLHVLKKVIFFLLLFSFDMAYEGQSFFSHAKYRKNYKKISQ